MRIKVLFLLALMSINSMMAQYQYLFLDPSKSFKERAANIVTLLTLDEKISQMMNDAPAIDRLGIPAYNWWNECLHGVARSPYRVTSFPQAIGMAATWDKDALFTMAEYASDEGRAIYNDASSKGITGIYLGLTFWSPNVNIFRDPRWGRGQETYGEDPYLTSQLGMAFVKGLQGTDLRYLKTSACAKHYAVHSGPEWNRSFFNAKVSTQDLWDTYLPAFQKLVVDSKVSGVMCAYNAFEGQPCCGNDLLMMDILRKQWGFTGYVTSDCGGINHFFQRHKTHPNKQSAAADAVLHGTDCECSSNGAYHALDVAIKEGLITENQIDVSLQRLFEIRLRLGMFDPKEIVPYSKITTDVLECDKHKKHALRMAQESIVLLKNENDLLPLNKNKIRKIAIVGPNATSENVMLGNYFGLPTKTWSVVDGIKERLGNDVEIIYEPGCSYVDNLVFRRNWDSSCFSYKGKLGFYAEFYTNPSFKSNPQSTKIVDNINFQHGDGEYVSEGIPANHISIRYTADYKPKKNGEISFSLTGDDGYKLYIDDKLCIDSKKGDKYYTLKAEKDRSYKVVIEYWQYSDVCELHFNTGRLWNADTYETAQSVKDADVILFAGGISASLEGEAMTVHAEGFKGGDRTSIALPTVQTDLLKELHKTGKPVIFLMLTGSALGIEWEVDHIPAILNAWYPGQAGGLAIADVLFGDYNPSGRLPVTFYKSEKDLPEFENYNMDNRTYRFFDGDVCFPFGHGLSYTRFVYDNISVKKEGNNYIVEAELRNIGDRTGDEVVQLYVSNRNKDYRTPIRSLKGFDRITLNPGEGRKVKFVISDDELYLVNPCGEKEKMKGKTIMSIGGGQPIEGVEYVSKTINL